MIVLPAQHGERRKEFTEDRRTAVLPWRWSTGITVNRDRKMKMPHVSNTPVGNGRLLWGQSLCLVQALGYPRCLARIKHCKVKSSNSNRIKFAEELSAPVTNCEGSFHRRTKVKLHQPWSFLCTSHECLTRKGTRHTKKWLWKTRVT